MHDSNKKTEPVPEEQKISDEDVAIAKRRKLIGQVLIGSPAVLLMTTKSLRAQDTMTTVSAAGKSEPEPTS